ncbi:MAG: hypothetical protein CTY36_09375 [Methylocystis sp.]|nr:MAG: hypothetical protein CTY36_09375 [Methylocystis sp.]
MLVAILIAERAAPAAFKRGWSCGKRSGAATADGDYFPPRPQGRFAARSKIAATSRPSLSFGRSAVRAGSPCRLGRP